MVPQKYINFKQALEYFVTHLEYIQNKNSNISGYTKYLKPFIDRGTFKIQGSGYSEKRYYKIQDQIAPYSEYEYGRLFITIEPSKGYGGYTNKGCYLHWVTTAINIVAVWKQSNKKYHINGLQILNLKRKNDGWNRDNVIDEKSLTELDLFSRNAPNQNLIEFYDNFEILLFENEDKKNITIESRFGITSHKAPKERFFRSSSCEKVIEIKHTDIQEKIIQKLKKQYGQDAVFQEVIIGNNRLDVLVMINVNNKIVYDIYEVKPYRSFYACVREATGQLMEYKYKAQENGLIIRKLIIAGPAKIDTKFLKYIQNEYSQSFDYIQII